ncbi:hypothetical protein KIW84_062683 [Lathyrus oleraceus]|uniref:Uncharacterized protein n=1 Tax=Pisum sativum TaxID=3888 RepID=A0A9D4W5T7_PEA|nr:hypothetical protein KIW84_062683 [Pisum sativum]
MESLQVLQLCYNQLTGSILTHLGDLKKLSVLALQSNKLAEAIPASLGDLGMLMRLDLSSNNLFCSIPTRLVDAPFLQVLDVHNNTLSGNVPPALKRLDDKFVRTKTENEKSYLFKKNGNNGWEGSNVQKKIFFGTLPRTPPGASPLGTPAGRCPAPRQGLRPLEPRFQLLAVNYTLALRACTPHYS